MEVGMFVRTSGILAEWWSSLRSFRPLTDAHKAFDKKNKVRWRLSLRNSEEIMDLVDLNGEITKTFVWSQELDEKQTLASIDRTRLQVLRNVTQTSWFRSTGKVVVHKHGSEKYTQGPPIFNPN